MNYRDVEINKAFPEIEHTYINEKLPQLRGDIARQITLVEAFLMTADPHYLEELSNNLKWLTNPDSPFQRELTYIASKLS